MEPNYIGRFAPSPTGPLHFGSLVAALASYLDARHHQGTWLLRIEDLDPPRESAEAPDIIMSQLDRLGLHWDQTPIFQSQRLPRYQEVLEQLKSLGLLYQCTCSRKSFAQVYPGRCRGIQSAEPPTATRIQLPNESLSFSDLVQGHCTFHLEQDIGDFILKRKDGLFAYQLAVVVDDHEQGVTHILRGSDLLDSTPRQIFLYQQLGYPLPIYGHIPVLVGSDGHKLSKQAHARAVSLDEPVATLQLALKVLNQTIPEGTTPAQILEQAAANWRLDLVAKAMSVPSPVI